MNINKKYLLIGLFTLSFTVESTLTFAHRDTVAKIYTVSRKEHAKAKVTYIATRRSMDENYRAPRSKVVTDLQLINIVTKEAINKAREQALGKAYERCYRDFIHCHEVSMQVIKTEASRVKTHTDEIDSGLAVEIEKSARAKAKVEIQVRGDTTGQHGAKIEERRALPQELPSTVKQPQELNEESQESESETTAISGAELVSMAIEQM